MVNSATRVNLMGADWVKETGAIVNSAEQLSTFPAKMVFATNAVVLDHSKMQEAFQYVDVDHAEVSFSVKALSSHDIAAMIPKDLDTEKRNKIFHVINEYRDVFEYTEKSGEISSATLPHFEGCNPSFKEDKKIFARGDC